MVVPYHRPDILLIGRNWSPRALLRAQLIEEGFDVVAVDSWSDARRCFLRGDRPRAVVVDLQGLPHPEAVLRELGAIMDVTRVFLIAAEGTVPPETAAALGFHVLRRPLEVGQVVAAVAHVLR